MTAMPGSAAPSRSRPAPLFTLFTPLPVRLWHWLNAAAILALIVTGVQIRFADRLHLLDFRRAVAIHEWAGVAVIALFFHWGFYYGLVSRTLWRLYVPTVDEIWPGLLRQAWFYLWGYFRGAPHPYHASPDNKFNPMQKLFYAILMFVALPLLCLTGVLLLNLTPLREWLTQVGGIKLTLGLHVLLGAFVAMFLSIHLYLCTLGRTFWSGFRSMLTGINDPD